MDTTRYTPTETPSPDLVDGYFKGVSGIYQPTIPIQHHEDSFDEVWFEFLQHMQHSHFWHLGRREYVWKVLWNHKKHLRYPFKAIDIGGGCGGWVDYLSIKAKGEFSELALADSSLVALQNAKQFLNPSIKCYQVDNQRLSWNARWDCIFMLDVLEHLDEDTQAVRQVYKALRPGGVFLATVPAFQSFWSHNDEFVGHRRRYIKQDFKEFAQLSGFEILDLRYFCFLLSPLMLLSRLIRPKLDRNDKKAVEAYVRKSHQVPAPLINRLLKNVFTLESRLYPTPFPWGSSLVALLQKPVNN